MNANELLSMRILKETNYLSQIKSIGNIRCWESDYSAIISINSILFTIYFAGRLRLLSILYKTIRNVYRRSILKFYCSINENLVLKLTTIFLIFTQFSKSLFKI